MNNRQDIEESYYELETALREEYARFFDAELEAAYREYSYKNGTNLNRLKHCTPFLTIYGCIADLMHIMINDRSKYDEMSMYLRNWCADTHNKLTIQQECQEHGQVPDDPISDRRIKKLRYLDQVNMQIDFVNSRSN